MRIDHPAPSHYRPLGQTQIGRQVLHQETLGRAPASEQHDAVLGDLAAPAPVSLEQLQQALVFGEVRRGDRREQGSSSCKAA